MRKKCKCCGNKITFENSPYGANYIQEYGYICEECWAIECFNACIECQKGFLNDNSQMFDTGSGFLCKTCAKKLAENKN